MTIDEMPQIAVRCPWCGTDPLYVAYHDEEWGVPSHDDRHLFEMLILEGAQAGLSWITILRKREAYRDGVCRVRSGRSRPFHAGVASNASCRTPASSATG